jgi:hypothetical protein
MAASTADEVGEADPEETHQEDDDEEAGGEQRRAVGGADVPVGGLEDAPPDQEGEPVATLAAGHDARHRIGTGGEHEGGRRSDRHPAGGMGQHDARVDAQARGAEIASGLDQTAVEARERRPDRQGHEQHRGVDHGDEHGASIDHGGGGDALAGRGEEGGESASGVEDLGPGVGAQDLVQGVGHDQRGGKRRGPAGPIGEGEAVSDGVADHQRDDRDEESEAEGVDQHTGMEAAEAGVVGEAVDDLRLARLGAEAEHTVGEHADAAIEIGAPFGLDGVLPVPADGGDLVLEAIDFDRHRQRGRVDRSQRSADQSGERRQDEADQPQADEAPEQDGEVGAVGATDLAHRLASPGRSTGKAIASSAWKPTAWRLGSSRSCRPRLGRFMTRRVSPTAKSWATVEIGRAHV